MNLYQEEILDHYKNPRNYGDLEEATATREEYNDLCGDRIFLQLKITSSETGKKVERAMFKAEGCAISQASASIFTDYIKGKNLGELRKISPEEVLENSGLKNLAPARLKCALLSYEAMRYILAEHKN